MWSRAPIYSRWLLPALCVLLCAGTPAGVARSEVISLGGLELEVGGSFSPKRLPAKRLSPIALRAFGAIRRIDGGVPPGLEQMVLDFDRNGTVRNKGLPTCGPRRLLDRNTEAALAACRSSLVGRGDVRAIVDFPDQAPFEARGPLLAFNGRSRGGPRLIIFHAYANVPAPTAFVVPSRITSAPGRVFGKRLTVDVPTIAGGSGHLTDFEIEVERRFRAPRGGRGSYLVARCATGHFVVEGDFRFRDGSRVNGSVVRSCKARRR